MKAVQRKKNAVSLPTNPRGRPRKVTLEMRRLMQEKKKLEQEKKMLEEEKQREKEKKLEEEKRLEEEKKRLQEKKKLEEQKKREEEEKKREEKKRDEKKKREEKKREEKKKQDKEKKKQENREQDKEKKKQEENKEQEEQTKKGEEEKKYDENRRRGENRQEFEKEPTWKRGRDDRRRGDDNRSRSRYRSRDYTPEINQRLRYRDYSPAIYGHGYRRTSRSPPFRCTHQQPYNFEEVEMLRAKVRELEHAVAQGRLREPPVVGTKFSEFQQPLQPHAPSTHEENEILKLKTRIRYYQQNNSDLKKKLDYCNKKIAELERLRMPPPLAFYPPTNTSQHLQPPGYYNNQTERKFY